MTDSVQSGTIVTKLLELARLDAKYLQDLERFRRAIVVMFTDIRGSTAYFEQHGDVAGLLLVHECNKIIRRIVEKHGGRLIKTVGDGSLATFDECPSAVAAAMEMQSTFSKINLSRTPEQQTAIRVGIHYGTGIVKSEDVFGDVVNMASRVESAALPEQILISEPLHEQIKSAGFKIVERGRFSLKGKSGEQVLFEVLWKPEGVVKPPSGGRPAEPAATPAYKVQVLRLDGSPAAEHLLKSGLSIGRSQGDIQVPSDPKMSPLHARLFLEGGEVFIEEISKGSQNVFLRLSTAYTLQDGDFIIMGNQAFRFNENSAAMSAATMLGATVADLSALDEPVAEFVQLDEAGNAVHQYPLRSEAVEFGRTQGTYRFPEDKLMSRLHARVLHRGEDFLIKDAGSRNGSFVRVRGKVLVPPGSIVLVGSCFLKLVEAP